AWPAPSDPHEAIDDQEHDLAVLRQLFDDQDRERVKGHAHYLLKLNECLRRSVIDRWARGEPRWSVNDGLTRVAPDTRAVLAGQRLTARPYSLSALQRRERVRAGGEPLPCQHGARIWCNSSQPIVHRPARFTPRPPIDYRTPEAFVQLQQIMRVPFDAFAVLIVEQLPEDREIVFLVIDRFMRIRGRGPGQRGIAGHARARLQPLVIGHP